MVEQNASEQEIDKYISLEGTTPEEIRNFKGDTSVREELPAIDEPQRQFPLEEFAPAGLGLAAGAGAAYELGRMYRRPFRERNIIGKEILGIEEQLGLKAPSPSWLQRRKEMFFPPSPKEVIARMPVKAADVPQRIIQLQQQAKQDYNFQVAEVNSRSNEANIVLKQHLNDFDRGILAKKVDDFTLNLDKQDPIFRKNVSEAFGKGLKPIESFMAKQGVTLDSFDFNTNVVTKSIDEALSRNIPLESLEKLTGVKNKLAWSKDVAKPMGISQAIHLKNQMLGKTPYDEVSTIVRKNYGEFLTNKVPVEVRPQYTKLNANFAEYAKLRTKLSGLQNAAGKFDRTKTVNWTMDYITNKIDTGAKEVMQLVSEGNKLVTPMEGMAPQVQGLQQLKAQRLALTEAPARVNIARTIKIRTLAKQLQTKTNEFRMWLSKGKDLSSKLSTSQTIVNQKSAAARIPGLRNAVSKGYPLLSVGVNLYMMMGGIEGAIGMYESSKKPFPQGLIEMLGRTAGIPAMTEEEARKYAPEA